MFFLFVSLGKTTLNILQRLDKLKLFLILGLIIISLLAWTIPESTHGSVAFSFPICLSDFDNRSTLLKCVKSTLTNPFDGWYVPGIKYSLLGFLRSQKTLLCFYIYGQFV